LRFNFIFRLECTDVFDALFCSAILMGLLGLSALPCVEGHYQGEIRVYTAPHDVYIGAVFSIQYEITIPMFKPAPGAYFVVAPYRARVRERPSDVDVRSFIANPPQLNRTEAASGILRYRLWYDTKRVKTGVYRARYMYAYPDQNGLIKYSVGASSYAFYVNGPSGLKITVNGTLGPFFPGDVGVIQWNAKVIPVPPLPFPDDPNAANAPFEDWFYTVAIYPVAIETPTLNDVIFVRDFYLLGSDEYNNGTRQFTAFINTRPDLPPLQYKAHYIFATFSFGELRFTSLAESKPITFVGAPGGRGCAAVSVADTSSPPRVSITCRNCHISLYFPLQSFQDSPGNWTVYNATGSRIASGRGFTHAENLEISFTVRNDGSSEYTFSVNVYADLPNDEVTGMFALQYPRTPCPRDRTQGTSESPPPSQESVRDHIFKHKPNGL